MKRSILTIVFLGFCGVLSFSENSLTIIYSASLNGNLDGCNCTMDPKAGLVTRAAYLRGINQRDRVILLEAGNVFYPLPDELLAREILEAYKDLGYQAIAVGNQEFSLGADALLELKRKFPLVSHNISVGPGQVISPDPLIITKGAHRIGVASVTDPAVLESIPEDARSRVTVESLPTALARLLPAFDRKNVDLTILLYHGLYDKAKRLLSAFNEIDVLILGHQELLIDAEKVGNSILVSPGGEGNKLGVLEVLFAENGSKTFNNSFLAFDYKRDPKDPSVMGRIERYRMERKKRLTKAGSRPVSRPASGDRISLHYYFTPGCRNCRRFLDQTIPELERKLNIEVDVLEKNILDSDTYREYLGMLAELGETEQAYPTLMMDRTVIQGETEINRRIEQELRIQAASKRAASSTRESEAKPQVVARKLAIIPVVSAGLLDGINPCAFTTIIFLLTALALAGKRRREILILGLFFALSVFVTYFLLGLGLFEAIRVTAAFPIVAGALRWALVSVLVLFAGLSLYDYHLIRRGRASEMTLQLPDFFKKRIRATIKSGARSAALVASSLALGFLVSLFELACTGQVYFPFLVFIVRNERSLSGYLFLLLYNLGFILPLFAVFFVTYRGVSSRRLTELFQKHMGKVKIGLASVFILMAVLTIMT
jgi:cytochrome c biogenesis protein CcdA